MQPVDGSATTAAAVNLGLNKGTEPGADGMGLWWTASFMVGWLALGVGYVVVVILRRRAKRHRPANGADPIYIQRVSVATDLTPLIGGLEREGIRFEGPIPRGAIISAADWRCDDCREANRR